MDFIVSEEIKSDLSGIIDGLGFSHINAQNVVCFKSYGSKSRAIARIWSLPKIWQIALKKSPHYCLEVISERFDRLSKSEQEKVLIHELLHIPKNFSGSLLSHNHNGRRINRSVVERLFTQLLLNKK